MLVLLSEYHRPTFIFSIREIIVHGHPVVAVVVVVVGGGGDGGGGGGGGGGVEKEDEDEDEDETKNTETTTQQNCHAPGMKHIHTSGTHHVFHTL
jgi:hypothetical protein